MRLTTLLPAAVPALVLSAACGVDIEADPTTNVDGDSNTEASVDTVNVDEVDADTDIDSEVNTDVDVDVGIGSGNGADVDINVDSNDDVVADVVGDGFGFDSSYRGVVFEERVMTPTFSAAMRPQVDSVEWLVRDPIFDEPTVVDDAAAFAWGDADSSDDDGDEYLLGMSFGDNVDAPFAWNTASRICTDDCAPRSISAVCGAELIMRVWLNDGSALDAVGEHISARVTCPSR